MVALWHAVINWVASIGNPVGVHIFTIVVPFARIRCVGHAIPIVVNNFIASIRHTVCIFVDIVRAFRACIEVVGDAVSIGIVHATITVGVQPPCLCLGAGVMPRLKVRSNGDVHVHAFNVRRRVMCGFEHSVEGGARTVAIRYSLALRVGSIGANWVDIAPDDFTGAIDFIHGALGPLSDQHVTV